MRVFNLGIQLLALCLSIGSASLAFSAPETTLVLVGGGNLPADAVRRLVYKAQDKPIWILPWATSKPKETYEWVSGEFFNSGARKVFAQFETDLNPEELEAFKAKLSNAGAIFFPGGSQVTLMERLNKLNLVPFLRKLYANGTAFGGSSAGTAIQSNPMIAGNLEENGLVPMAEGLGLLPNFIVDQHYLLRNREPRLLQALAQLNNPNYRGMGVDENMSVVITNGNYFEALGPTQVMLYELTPGASPSLSNYKSHAIANEELFSLPGACDGSLNTTPALLSQ